MRSLLRLLSVAAVLGLAAGSAAPAHAQGPAPAVKSAEDVAKGFDRRTRSLARPVRSTTRSLTEAPLDARGIIEVKREKPGDAAVQETAVHVVPGSAQAFDNILFVLGTTRFASDTSRLQLQEIAAAMKARPDHRFLVEGHTCDLGDEATNKTLSEQRAEAVRAFLLGEKVHPEQLYTLGFGMSEPATPNQDDESRRQNRRVVIYVRDVGK